LAADRPSAELPPFAVLALLAVPMPAAPFDTSDLPPVPLLDVAPVEVLAELLVGRQKPR
jgi:hypothetical protein